jgi:two-component system response regulator YesN
MQKAAELLGTSSLSVKEIAVSVGINDPSHFVRDFKKSHGLTPSQYRQKSSTSEIPRRSVKRKETIGQ